MRIKSLEMSGFKSFCDRTVVQFEDGITGVVGPNGCGKSNIVDAIRWVMGEMSAKHLRGSAMEDVIFNGCDTRSPVGMSQVFLTFDNSDGRAPPDYAQYSEIQVGRRLYRSGESEYFINKTPCRLKDIVDLFLGTGVGTKAYSIVEQGMVSHIVSSKPEDRRMLIEEAAGISKFKSRKEAAMRKMDSTRQNLARLTDVLSELTRQINSLNRQAKKAERFRRINDELRTRELALAATRYSQLKNEYDNLVSENERLSELKVASSAELSTSENALETIRLALAGVEREIDGVQQELYGVQHSVKLYESEIQHRLKETSEKEGYAESSARELDEFESSARRLGEEIDAVNLKLIEADLCEAGSAKVTGELEKDVEGLRSVHGEKCGERDSISSGIVSDGEAIANLNAGLEHLGRRKVDVAARIARDQAEVDSVDRRLVQISEETEVRTKEVDSCSQLKDELVNEREAALQNLKSERNLLETADGNLQDARDSFSDRRSRLESLRELRKNLEGYRDGVRAVMNRVDSDGEKLAGIVGTVSDLVETEPEYETALSAVLGEKLQYVVVKSHSEGVDAIDYLRTSASGRSSFIPLDVRMASDASEEMTGEGVVGPLSNFVAYDDDLQHVFSNLLGDVVLVEDLNRAVNLWQSSSMKKTFVTRNGDVVDSAGVVTGGYGTGVEEQLIAQKRKVKELEAEFNELNKKVSEHEGEAALVAERVHSIDETIESLGRDAHSEEMKLLGLTRDRDQLSDEQKRREKERDDLTVEAAALAEELARIETEMTESSGRLKRHSTDRDVARGRFSELEQEIEIVGSDLSERETELIKLKVDLAQAEEKRGSAEREMNSLISSRVDVILGAGRRRAEKAEALQRVSVLSRETEGLRFDLDLAIRSVAKLQESQRVLTDRYETESARVRDEELKIRETRKKHAESLSEFHDVEIQLTEHRGKVQYLTDGIHERYRVDLSEVAGEYARGDLDLETEELEVDVLKEKVSKIGSVNVDAIKEFEELSERQQFLSKQHEDLTASLENLSKAIAKINRTSRQRFRRAFEMVDEQFQMLFPKLFAGGKAKLMLTDEENLLETGVEIIAQPPGKKLQSITLLSGGEKALTAVALVFSIFLIKPSPFCLLDEVDAPLDDANIDRFNDLIRSMTSRSQFILITHNKRTMEQADLLYGVTMEERGVSKLVSVKLGVDAIDGDGKVEVA